MKRPPERAAGGCVFVKAARAAFSESRGRLESGKKHFSVGENPLKRVEKTNSNRGISVGKTHSNPE
jgi:hypothetical protein